MWDWMSENARVISMLASIGTALIWLVYLQIIVSGNRRQRRALLSINSGAGKNLGTHLVLCNLGFETVFVTDVIAEIRAGQTTYATNVTDCDTDPHPAPSEPLDGTLQGPLGTGDCRALGTVQDLIDRMAKENGRDAINQGERLSIVVIATREHSIGIRRNYRLFMENGELHLDADAMHSKRISHKQALRYRQTWGYDSPRNRVDRTESAL